MYRRIEGRIEDIIRRCEGMKKRAEVVEERRKQMLQVERNTLTRRGMIITGGHSDHTEHTHETARGRVHSRSQYNI